MHTFSFESVRLTRHSLSLSTLGIARATKDEHRGKEHTIFQYYLVFVFVSCTTHSRIHTFILISTSVCSVRVNRIEYICGVEWAHWAQARSDQHRVTNTRTQQQQQLHTIFELSRDDNCASGEKMPLVHSEHSRIIVRYSGFIANHLAPLNIQQQIIERKIFYFQIPRLCWEVNNFLLFKNNFFGLSEKTDFYLGKKGRKKLKSISGEIASRMSTFCRFDCFRHCYC